MRLKVTYVNTDGEELCFKEEAPFFLQNFSGLDTVENVITSEDVYGNDGAKVVGIRLSTRKPILEGTLIGEDEEDIYTLRRSMIKIIDLKEPGLLKINIYDREYEVDVLPLQAPTFKLFANDPGKIDEANLFSMQFEAFDPYLRDVSYYNSLVPLADLSPKFHFPVIFKPNEKNIFGVYITGDIITVHNDGDVPVGATFYMKCVNEVKNPMIYDVTKQSFFGFRGTYEAGTKFELSTKAGNLYAKKFVNGKESNAMSERLPSSQFLKLTKGENYFQVRADNSTVNGFICEMQYTPLVSGV